MTARRSGTGVERWQELVEVRNLIEAHRAAMTAWADVFEVKERRVLHKGCVTDGDLEDATIRERSALDTLLRWRPSTLRGEAERLRYLLVDPCSPWHGMLSEPDRVDLLIASMDGR